MAGEQSCSPSTPSSYRLAGLRTQVVCSTGENWNYGSGGAALLSFMLQKHHQQNSPEEVRFLRTSGFCCFPGTSTGPKERPLKYYAHCSCNEKGCRSPSWEEACGAGWGLSPSSRWALAFPWGGPGSVPAPSQSAHFSVVVSVIYAILASDKSPMTRRSL